MSDWFASARVVLRTVGRRFPTEAAFLVVLVLAVYGLRIGDLTIRGEESRWAQVAREMQQTGDWIVPRQQGEPLLSRPPLQSWLIALACQLRGQMDPVAVRMPALMAILLTTLLVYLYSRQLLDRLGALAAGCAFATFAEVLHLGRYAESEACFALFITASLLIWHWGHTHSWSRTVTWIVCYALAGLGALTKGPQAPVYFAGGVGVYLLLRRDWRWLFCTGHLFGVLAFLTVVGAWQVPLARQVGWLESCRVWSGDTAMRWVHRRTAGEVLGHLALYPLEIAACLLPWSALLMAYASRSFREKLGPARPMVVFLATCLLVAFPTCWLTPGSMTRYFLPMYPCVAPLVGLVVQRWGAAAVPDIVIQVGRRLLIGMAVGMAAVAGVVLAVSWLPVSGAVSPWAQPGGFAFGYSLTGFVAAFLIWRHQTVTTRPAGRLVVLALTCFLGFTYAGVIVNTLQKRSLAAGPEVARVRSLIPPGEKLVSIDSVHHLFAYYYPEPIPMHPFFFRATRYKDVRYFCVHVEKGRVPPLPFPWEQIAAVPMDRNRLDKPEQVELIGRVIPDESEPPLASAPTPTPSTGAAGSSVRQAVYRRGEE